MKEVKRPYLVASLFTCLILIFPIISGAISVINQLGRSETFIVQGLAFLVACILGYILGSRYTPLSELSPIKPAHISSMRSYLWFLPIIISELIPFFFGLRSDISYYSLAATLFFTLIVGIVEELYFRGIIPKILNEKGPIKVIAVSTFLFSFGHILNLLSGANLMNTVMQIIFAGIFGFVAIMIVMGTGSLMVPTLWHFAHNFISLITSENEGPDAIMAGILQGSILLLYGIFLWKQDMSGKSDQPLVQRSEINARN